ncbi:MAG: peptidoglycan bridge formation glycyltransferase FemA/FemB family protein [Patescibacteria group bacterium]|nr:peptidoglycan bridge formation glycyltransferase FemA/FemB family protein [Patescibacteria group bacterium]
MSNHPLQSLEWGEFRKKTAVKVIREGNFQMTIHQIPHLPWSVGYIPKGDLPNKEFINKLRKIGKENNCIFIQLEPNILATNNKPRITNLGLVPAAHPLFTKYTFVLDLTKSEDELLKAMHQKTRYNIRVSEKHGVKIIEDNSDKAFKEYLKLTEETTKRQNFHAHTQKYHKLMWETLRPKTNDQKLKTDSLIAHLLLAKYKNETLAAWILFVYKDTLYYPYGASSEKHRETMASNLMMWEAIKFGKKLGLKKFDMWGALGPNPDPKDPWYGFHKFKQGYGGDLVEFVGSYDFVINPFLYNLYRLTDKIRWFFLRTR